MSLPWEGRSAEDVAADLEAYGAEDADIDAGRVFGLVFHAGADVDAVLRQAHDRYVFHNALNPDVLPSLRRMSADVVDAATWLLSGGAVDAGDDVRGGLTGFLTSGGTESILMAVKTAKVRGREGRGIEHGNVVLPTSAHAAFDKAGDYFGVELRRVAVGDDWRCDVDAMADACDDATVLVVASAPQYPQGVIDPVAEVAALGVDRDVSCHVDACMGGFTLPFLERAGLVDGARRPWDFRVPGVTTISADLHKYGFAPKGISVILHRDKSSRRRQTFVTDAWLGGFYGSSGVLGTKPGGPIAAGWAALQYLGVDGYVEKATMAFRARERMVAGVRATEGLTVLGEPDVTLCAISADTASGVAVDPFAVGEGLRARGWHLDRQGPPDSLHATCMPVHDTGRVMDDFLTDLRAVVADVGATRTEDRATNYAALE
jgi:glutamate/tyrosine decarboxylase-like PLP-dependent enzyme